MHAGSTSENGENGNGKDVYDFYLNVDNFYLKTELKAGGVEPEVTKARFVYGMVLLGLGLLHQEAQGRKSQPDYEEVGLGDLNGQANVEDKVEEFTRAIAPVLLPMIDHLAPLELEEDWVTDVSGEAS